MSEEDKKALRRLGVVLLVAALFDALIIGLSFYIE